MSNYGQQPPYGQNPYGQQPNPYGPAQPYGQPARPNQPYPPQSPYPQGYPPQPGYGPPGAAAPGAPGAWPGQPATRKPELVRHPLPVVTMDKLVGHEITEVLGEVIGVVARTRELRPDLRVGNLVDGYAAMLTESRQEAVGRLVEMAVAAGADAVVGLRFDCSEITQSLSEVAAYGTAVKLAGGRSGDHQASEHRTTGQRTAAEHVEEEPAPEAPRSAGGPMIHPPAPHTPASELPPPRSSAWPTQS